MYNAIELLPQQQPPEKNFTAQQGINVDQYSKPRNHRKYGILYLQLFRSFEYWYTLIL